MTILLKFWKEILIVVLSIVIYIQYKNKPEPKVEVQVQEKIVYKDKIVYVDKVIVEEEVITKPDGTRTEKKKRTETKKSKEETKKKEDKKQEIQIPLAPPPSMHVNLGLDVLSKFKRDEYVMLFGGGLRLGKTPFLITLNPTINLSKAKFENVFVGITWEID